MSDIDLTGKSGGLDLSDLRERLAIPAAGDVTIAPAPAVKPGDTVDLTTGRAPAYVPDRLLGQPPPQKVPATPQQVSLSLPASAAPAPQVNPATMIPVQSQTTFTSGTRVDPKLVKEADKLAEAQKELVTKQAEVEARVADGEALALQARNSQMQKAQQQHDAEQADIAKRVEKSRADFDASVDEFSKYRANPNRFWESRGTASGIVGALVRAMGAFGSFYTKTPNEGAAVLDRAIENDLRAQESEQRALGQKVNFKQNAYAFMRQKGLDHEQAYLAAKASMYEAARQKIEALAAGSKNETLLNNAKIMNLATDAKLNEIHQRQFQDAQGKATRGTVYQPMGGGGIGTDEFKKLADIAREDEYLKAWRGARGAADRFEALVAAKADGAAIMDFIASGMKQGSFTPTFIDMLKKRGYLDAAGEAIRSKIKGGYDPNLMRELGSALQSASATTFKRAEPVIRGLAERGLPPNYIMGGNNEPENAAALGGVKK